MSLFYDDAGELTGQSNKAGTVTEGGNSATYSYVANAPLVDNIVFKQGTTERMRTTKVYDRLNRLLSISSTANGTFSPVFSDRYQYNNANQRVLTSLADGSYWDYRYDALGQVISGKRYWSDGTPVAGQQFEYVADDIGNRKSAKSGGDAAGLNLRFSSYTSDYQNRYANRTVPATFDVNGATPYRKGEYFRQEITASPRPAWTSISVASPTQTTVTGNSFTPATPESYTYDMDGNLLTDGRWTYAWDGENRLLSMTARTSVEPQQFIEFEYDWQGRRIHKQVWNNTAGTGVAAVDQRFVYDGWNLIGMIDTANTLKQSYTWGLDLSGSAQGAGGVGGLLWVYDASTLGSATRHFAAFDGNGNVTGLINAADGTTTVQYEHGPFGEVIRMTGPMAKANPFRFSTKYQDDETDLLYYSYRYYNPSTGRWLSRDPIEEKLELDLYEYVLNDPVNEFDPVGLFPGDPGSDLFDCVRDRFEWEFTKFLGISGFDVRGKPDDLGNAWIRFEFTKCHKCCQGGLRELKRYDLDAGASGKGPKIRPFPHIPVFYAQVVFDGGGAVGLTLNPCPKRATGGGVSTSKSV